MTREDKLKPAEDGSPQSCNPVRSVDHKCGGGQRSNKERKHKDKGKLEIYRSKTPLPNSLFLLTGTRRTVLQI